MQNQEAYTQARRYAARPDTHPFFSRIESPEWIHQELIRAAYNRAYTELGRGKSKRYHKDTISLESVLASQRRQHRYWAMGGYNVSDEQSQALDDLVKAGIFTIDTNCHSRYPLGVVRLHD